jgi:ribose transport system substrate-binding protein
MRNVAPFWTFFRLFALLLLSGCGQPSEPPVAKQPAKQFAVGVSLCKTDGPWRAQMKSDIETAAAKEAALKLSVMDAQNDPARQQAQLEEFLNSHVNLVIVSPGDSQAITETVTRLIDGGIPVIVLDRPVIGDKYTCFIAADPTQIGTAAGNWLAGRLRGKGKLVEIKGPVDSLQADALQTAFRAVFRDPGYRFVFDDCVDPPKIDAAKLMNEALSHVQQIDAVFAYDDAAGRAAYETAKAAGREKDVLFLGIGGMPAEGEAFVQQGILDATFLFPTGGAEAIDIAVKVLRGEKVPKKIVPPTRVLTKENIPRSDETAK